MDTANKILKQVHRKTIGTTDENDISYIVKGREVAFAMEFEYGGKDRVNRIFEQVISEMTLKGVLSRTEYILMYVCASAAKPYLIREARILEWELGKRFFENTPQVKAIYHEDDALQDRLLVGLLLWENLYQ